jgi:hypothetical protein
MEMREHSLVISRMHVGELACLELVFRLALSKTLSSTVYSMAGTDLI